MSTAIYNALDQLLLLAGIACVLMWGKLLIERLRHPAGRSDPIVAVRPRERPFWTVADGLVMFGANIVLLASLQIWFSRQGWIDLPVDLEPGQAQTPSVHSFLARVTVTVIAGLASSAIALLWLRLVDVRAIGKLSLVPNRADLWLGLKGSVMLLPPVLLISAAVSHFQEYQHNVLNMLQQVDSLAVFAGMFLATAVVTPLVEEFLFRVLIQGGLQGMIDRHPSDPGRWQPRSYIPIILTSGLFAMMHLGQGAAPIPLYFLSLGLGYLYRQRGNITAPLVVHMLLNGLTMIANFTETTPA